jgi:hypothetical protein
MRSKLLVFMLLMFGVSQNSHAITECYGVPTGYFTEAGNTSGKVWVVMPNGLQWYVLQGAPGTSDIVAVLITSISTNEQIGVRFQADGVACDSTSGVRTDVLGTWLLRP